MGQDDTYELEELGYSEGEDVPYESSGEREAPAVAWIKRNKKILLIAAAVTFCFIVALVIVFGFILLSGGGDSAHPESSGDDYSSDDNNTPPPLQLTDEERGIRDFWIASVVPPFLGSLNRTADPCDNFYEFACGGWIDKTVIPADKTGVYKSFTSIDDSNEVILKEILEAGWPLLGPMYDQCMDVDSIEAKGAQPLWDFGLSLISVNSCLPTNNASSTFLAAIGNLHRYGLSALFDIQVSPDPADPSMNLFSIDQGGLGLPTRDYYFRNDSRTLAIQQAYKQHITNSFRLGSPQLTEQAAQSRAQQVYDFEWQLAKASMSPAQHRDPLATYHKYTMAQLTQLTPGIQWQQYFDTIRLPRDVTELNVAVPEFFSSLADQLYQAKSEDLCAYLEWRLLEQTSSLLSSSFLDETHFYSNQLTGRSQNPPRWKMCMSITESILGELLGRYYVQQTFSGDSKVRAQELIDRIKEAFAEHLPEVDWMDKETERAAQQKLDAVADKIGYPDQWDDLTGLNVAPDDFYMNVLNGWKYEFDAIIPQAGKPVDKSIWYMNPQDVNAYYDPLMNEMVFPAAILQPPFYHPRYPDALNFGGIGSVMGHELTHGFDDEGRNFDANGQLHQWWTDESIMAFEERTECPVAVYSEFPLDYPGNIDGEQTLGENLADMGGVKDAYRAFMKHMQETRPYTSLYTVAEELFGLTNEQLFFAAYGQVWCSVMKEEIAVMRLSTDVHSPGKARVDVPLAQTEEFGKAFKCPINSAMNPQEKCTVW